MSETLIHAVIPVGMLQCNCSILGDPVTHEAIVIDPGDEVETIQQILQQRALKVRAILSTHTHIDHVGGLAALQKLTGAPVLIHEADLPLYLGLDQQARWLGVPTPSTTTIKDFVKEGDALRWGPYEARVLHTPGHTPGSISLVVAKNQPGGPPFTDSHKPHPNDEPARLLAGDTLFQGSIGRTDLWGGSLPQILKSIHEKLLTLPEDVVVYPGHGETTTIGEEIEHNPFLR